jgi:hypothetical protein
LPYYAIPEVDEEKTHHPVLVVPNAHTERKRGNTASRCPRRGRQQKTLWAEVRKVTGRWKIRWKVLDLLADERCSRAVLDFLANTDVGGWFRPRWRRTRRLRRQSGYSGSGETERRRGEQMLMGWAPRLRNPFSSPRPLSWHLRRRSENALLFDSSFLLPFIMGKGCADARRKLATCRHRADSGEETVKMYAAIV